MKCMELWQWNNFCTTTLTQTIIQNTYTPTTHTLAEKDTTWPTKHLWYLGMFRVYIPEPSPLFNIIMKSKLYLINSNISPWCSPWRSYTILLSSKPPGSSQGCMLVPCLFPLWGTAKMNGAKNKGQRIGVHEHAKLPCWGEFVWVYLFLRLWSIHF